MNAKLSKIATIIIIDELLYDEEEKEKVQPKEQTKQKVEKKRKRIWSKNLNLTREEFSNDRLLKELKENESKQYENYAQIDEQTFLKLLDMIKHKITKQDTLMRQSISAEVRLNITLQYLATGNCFADLKLSTGISPQAIGQIVIETCEAINVSLKDYIKLPKTQAEWQIEAENFYEKSKFPHCLGVLEGKHVQIKKPPYSGSNYFNHKRTFSIVLMAIVNSASKFLMVDVDANGRLSDADIFKNSKLFEKMENGEINLPEPQPVFDDTPIPYVFIANNAFALQPYIMKPYSHSDLSSKEIFFNDSLSSVRVQAENAFGSLAARFKVLNTTITLVPEKVRKIVLSCCYLHNFIRREMYPAKSDTLTTELFDTKGFIDLEPTLAENSTIEAQEIRNNLCEAVYAQSLLEFVSE